MRKLFSLLIVIYLCNLSFGQTDNYISAIDNFKTNYNSKNHTGIYVYFSPEMKKAMPLESTKQFLDGLYSQVGKIQKTQFIIFGEGNFAIYKTKFDKGELAINVSLDSNNLINGLLIKPYSESSQIERDSLNALSSIPEELAKMFYSNAKDFPNNTQLSISITQNGKTNYHGIIKENDTLKSIQNYSKLFEIGSITKVFTSTVLASLVEENKINLSDHINASYNFKFKKNIKISFESLANHTSGLPRLPSNLDLSNEINPYKDYGEKELEFYLAKKLKLESKPMTSSSYSNLGAGLLGHTLGLSQKTSFNELLQKKIFDKYQMKNSFMNSHNVDHKLIKGLNEKGEIIPNWDFDVLFGAGGIVSSTEDLTKFAIAQFNLENKELTLTRKPTFTVNDQIKIGLGWHILKTKSGQEFVWHNGGTAGYSSSIAVNAVNKTAVVILSNVSPSHSKMGNIDKLCFELMKMSEHK
jgi:CubicO group peptidase (beta-lactamase class C family)